MDITKDEKTKPPPMKAAEPIHRGPLLRLALDHAAAVKMEGNEKARYLMGFEHGIDELLPQMQHLRDENELLRAKLAKAIEQRNVVLRECGRYDVIKMCDTELQSETQRGGLDGNGR